MTQDDEETLIRIMDEESEGGPLIMANQEAVEAIIDKIGTCQCEGCRYIAASLSIERFKEVLH
jgi:hypothetical protein